MVRSIPFQPSNPPRPGELSRAVFAFEYAKDVDAQLDALVPASRIPVRVEPKPIAGVVEICKDSNR